MQWNKTNDWRGKKNDDFLILIGSCNGIKQMIGGKNKDEIPSHSLTKEKKHILKQQGAPWEKGWCVNGNN
jgi:hypothetical protein